MAMTTPFPRRLPTTLERLSPPRVEKKVEDVNRQFDFDRARVIAFHLCDVMQFQSLSLSPRLKRARRPQNVLIRPCLERKTNNTMFILFYTERGIFRTGVLYIYMLYVIYLTIFALVLYKLKNEHLRPMIPRDLGEKNIVRLNIVASGHCRTRAASKSN